MPTVPAMASKQANEAFKVEIQALDAVKRDQDDGVIVTTFNNQQPWRRKICRSFSLNSRFKQASTVDFPAKTAAIEASKQANEAFKVEIQALDAVKRDQDDGVIVTTFNDQHQALKTQITDLPPV
jgi:regulator of RNase E activity RraB